MHLRPNLSGGGYIGALTALDVEGYQYEAYTVYSRRLEQVFVLAIRRVLTPVRCRLLVLHRR